MPLPQPWPDSTFVPEKPGTAHYRGSHWDPFLDDPAELMKRLPEITKQWLIVQGFGSSRRNPPRRVPEYWAKGWHFAWPLRVHGLIVTLALQPEINQIVSLCPFYAVGAQHTLTLNEVTIWEGGCEAQISASVGEAAIDFFDTQYLVNRDWYETGKSYEFILTGIAYAAQPAEVMEFKAKQPPEVIALLARKAEERGLEPSFEEEQTFSMAGMAMFLPVEGWDIDDYGFRGPIREVSEVKDVLGQDGWLVRAPVMRLSDYTTEDFDLKILITRRAWRGKEPPRIGQDVEGRLWLQGYLWYPHGWGLA